MEGIIFGICAAISWALGGVTVRIALQYLSPVLTTAVSLIVGFVLTILIVLIIYPNELHGFEASIFLWICLYGTLNFPLGRFLNYSAIRLVGVSRATPIFSTSTLFAILYGIILLDESVNLQLILGATIILVGVFLIVSDNNKVSDNNEK